MSETNTNTEQDETAVAQQIRDYLVNHPNAADSLEGIVAWWLGTPQRSTRLEIVRDALEQLQLKGLVVRRALPDGNTIYTATGGADSG